MRQRAQGAEAVARVEAAELHRLGDDEALRQADALLSAAPIAQMTADRRATSGFVEQQRLFMRVRR